MDLSRLLLPLLFASLLWFPASPAAGDAGWRWPLSPTPGVLRPFDPPEQRWLPGHRGADLAADPGQEVYAAGSGRVRFVGTVAGTPLVSVVHGDLRTTYLPVESDLARGDPVAAGDVLGVLAAAPLHCRDRPCLHWGLLRGDDYLDPLGLLGLGEVRLLPLGPARDDPPPGRRPRAAGALPARRLRSGGAAPRTRGGRGRAPRRRPRPDGRRVADFAPADAPGPLEGGGASRAGRRRRGERQTSRPPPVAPGARPQGRSPASAPARVWPLRCGRRARRRRALRPRGCGRDRPGPCGVGGPSARVRTSTASRSAGTTGVLRPRAGTAGRVEARRARQVPTSRPRGCDRRARLSAQARGWARR
ncbi:peptidoglycan DD-metalloendopeptidase family protein [Nocardiopsis sp. NPDC101807]|uniref:peptidoglycan DD-metalloendopeptidase family protein n=1 Tax=Nocardiopsis sp. NPDC101807 TaxID=3364339 RepID=UPI00382933C2